MYLDPIENLFFKSAPNGVKCLSYNPNGGGFSLGLLYGETSSLISADLFLNLVYETALSISYIPGGGF
jgi:hypothetical protein